MGQMLFIYIKVKGLIQKLVRKKKVDITISDEKNVGYETSFAGNKDSKFTYRHIRKA